MKRQADLNPPLGSPGGPCRVVQRIHDKVTDPSTKDKLVTEVEKGKDLTNPEAARVYPLEVETLPAGFFRKVQIGPHAGYRMDLRTITVPLIKQSVQNFVRAMESAKARGDYMYRIHKDALERGQTTEWEDPKLKLTVVLTLGSEQGVVKVVTAYWTGKKTPEKPRKPCPIVRSAYRAPASELPGAQTFVSNPDGTQDSSKPKDPVGPGPRSRSIPTPSYNMPPASSEAPDGRSLSQDRVRTLAQPGEDYGTPSIGPSQAGHRRRTMEGSFFYEKAPPLQEPGQTFNRGSERPLWPDNSPGADLAITEVRDNPGSAKVIPEGRGFVNRQAYKIAEIESLCGPDLRQKSRGLQIRLRKVDARSSTWAYDVRGSDQTYKVRIKALPKTSNLKDPKKVDVLVACSCPFWQWQGPEHWAKKHGYLLGQPRGTASVPGQKDPQHRHGACKHVLACLLAIKNFDLPGRTKLGSWSWGSVWRQESLVQRIARRYLEGRGEFYAPI